MRMQVLRERNFKQTIPVVKVEEGRDGDEKVALIKKETVTIALRRATKFFAALQSHHGHWPAENSGPMFYFPPLVLFLFLFILSYIILPQYYPFLFFSGIFVVYYGTSPQHILRALPKGNPSLCILSSKSRWWMGIAH